MKSACKFLAVLMLCVTSVLIDASGRQAGNSIPPAMNSGIDLGSIDNHVRPQDDFHEYVNGNCKSFMGEARLERLGLQPVHQDFNCIDAIRNRRQLAALIGEMGLTSSQSPASAPFALQIRQDSRNAAQYVASLQQGGIGLPNRDYFLKKDDEKMQLIRTQYQQHIENMLTLSRDHHAKEHAQDIFGLESQIAQIQWSAVELIDPVKAYNPAEISDLHRLMPDFDWRSYLQAAGIAGRSDRLIIGQPSYFQGLGQLFQVTSLETWKYYFRWHVLNDYAGALNKAVVDQDFLFNEEDLEGTQAVSPRWKSGIELINDNLGEALGRIYVAQYFPEQDKQRVNKLVTNLLAAFSADIDTLDRMTPETKQQAQIKLSKIAVKIA
jgi:predicted metalloendopeptidase